MKIKTAILIAMGSTKQPMGNDELCRAIGRAGMPQCTMTWHLNELADAGAVQCDNRGRWNRWSLTEYGTELSENACRQADRVVASKLAYRRAAAVSAPTPSALKRAPRTVFELALMLRHKNPPAHWQDLQMKLWESA